MATEKEVNAWLKKLGTALNNRARKTRTYESYFNGDHSLLFATEKFRSAFGGLLNSFADNFCPVVVNSVNERLNPEGFRIPRTPEEQGDTPGEETGDKEAWRIWQANYLDADSRLAHRTALIKSEASLLVWGNPDDQDTPLITVEDPDQMIVAFASGNRRHRLAALKRWKDDDSGHMFATLYLPDGLYKFKSVRKLRDDEKEILDTELRWERREVVDERWPLPNPLGIVPVVPLTNEPRSDGCGSSELSDVIPIQNAINKLCMDVLVASEFVAWPMRYGIGVDQPKDPVTQKPVEPLKAAFDRLWLVPKQGGSFGQLPGGDFGNHIKFIDTLIQHLASETRTPPHYFIAGMGTFPTGESLKASEIGLVAKVRDKMRYFGEGWEEAMRLAFAVLNDPRAKVTHSETIWGDPEYRSEAEHIDALIKQKALGIPDKFLWEQAGYTPTQIERIEQLRAEEMKLAATYPQATVTPRLGVSFAGGDLSPEQQAVGQDVAPPTT